jgi:sugar phosphate isomerase/epimerase
MKLGVSMWSYFHAWRAGRIDLPGFVREAKRIGADGVELLDFFDKGEREEVKAALAGTGLPCPIFSVGNDFARPEASARAAELAKIVNGLDQAGFYGAEVVRVFAGDVAEGITFEQARAWIVEGLAEASKEAHARGLRLALENHGRLAGRSDQVRGLIDDVRAKAGNDALGANPDTGNFLLVGQPSHEAIRDVAPVAYMVHFKDFRPAPEGHEGFAYGALDGSKFVGTAIGEGAVDLAACVAALKSAGYAGWLSVEYEAEEDPMTGVARSLQNARRFL